jgi:hypothetical protein
MTTGEACPDCGHAETDHAGAFGCQVEVGSDELCPCADDDDVPPMVP